MKIVHISDLHAGDAERSLLATAADSINALAPDVVVLSGDVTQAGRRNEFADAAWFLNLLGSPVVGAPGNHDSPVYNPMLRVLAPYARFSRLPVLSKWRSDDGMVDIATLNTARAIQFRPDWSQGAYPKSVTGLTSGPGWRIFVAHHPPIAPLGAPLQSKTHRGEAVWKQLGQSERTLLLCGHLHGFFQMRAPPSKAAGLIVAPTLASSRERGGGLGFVELTLAEHSFTTTVHHYNGASYAPSLFFDGAGNPSAA